jgi:hypothetical protein
MRNCGKQVVLLAWVAFALSACGGGADEGDRTGADNLPPVIGGTPTTQLMAGTQYTFTPQAADPDGDSLTFSIENKPSWASFTPATGTLTGTPTENDVGMSALITVEVSDSRAVVQLTPFRIQVMSAAPPQPGETNHPPLIQGTPATGATVGQVYSFMPVASDEDGDALSFTIENKPSWATFTPSTGELRGTPASNNVGTTSNIIIRVSDGELTAQLAAFNLAVEATAPVNRAPTISGTPGTSVTAGVAYSFRPVGNDPDGNTLQYAIQNKPSWASFSTTSGRLSGTPGTSDVGTSARITISVSDGSLSASLPSFTIQVNAPANRPPTITGTPSTSVTAGASYTFTPGATDPDANPLTFSIANKPAWATFNTSTGRLSGTPTVADVGSFSGIVITVSDGTASASLAAFGISVLQAANGTALISWTAPTTNTDGSALTNLSGFRVAYGRSESDMSQSASINNPGLNSYTVNNLSTGQWFFAVYAVNSSGIESSVSNVATKTIN